MTDFRALCARLADALDAWQLGGGPPEDTADSDLIAETRAALLGPVVGPAAPSDADLEDLAEVCNDCSVLAIRRALELWGNCTTPTPIPIAERLPEEVDCAPWSDDPDALPWCWVGKEVDGGWEWVQLGILGLRSKDLGRIIAGGGWTHWCASHALPRPAAPGEGA